MATLSNPPAVSAPPSHVQLLQPSPPLCCLRSHQSQPSSSSISLSIPPSSLKQPHISPLNTSPARRRRSNLLFVAAEVGQIREPLKVMISGAPASGKGTQCALITQKHSLVHISAGDLLRAEIAAGTDNGKRAKEYMTKGELVPNEIVVNIVKERLSQPDAREGGWLLDGYPRSLAQAEAIEALGIRPDVFILLEVPDDVLIERVVGRRLDPVTGKIYHLKFEPPENEEIARRLTQRFDDTDYQAKLRLQTHTQNVEAVLSIYGDVISKIDGNRPKEIVFQEIDNVLSNSLEKKSQSTMTSVGSHGSKP